MKQNGFNSKIIGIFLILVGIAVFLAQVFGITWGFFAPTWQLFIIVPGALLLVLSTTSKSAGRALAPLGMSITLTGVVLAGQAWADYYQSWAYAWIIVGPMAAGLGWLLYGIIHSDPKAQAEGRKFAIASFWGLVGAVAFFELAINLGGFRPSVDLPWTFISAIALIGAGVFFLTSHNRTNKEEDTNPPLDKP